jgi:hypothetical protein
MSELDDMPAGQAEAPVPKMKRRSCLVAPTVFFFVFLPLFALFLNGPGFRYLARYAGVKAAGSQGLLGDFEIDGNLWSGFTLNGINFVGDAEGSTSLTVEEFAVGYNALDLIRNSAKLTWLETVRIKKAHLNLYLPDPGEKTPEEKERAAKKAKKPPTEFSPLWNLLASDILIEDLTVFVHQGETTFAVQNLTLATPAAADGKLHIGKVDLPGQQPLETVKAVVSRRERELTFGPLPLLRYATLEKLTVAETEPGDWSVDALVRAADGMLITSFKSPGEIAVGLRAGSRLSLEKLVLPIPDGTPSPLKGSLTDLDLRFSGDFATPATWKFNGKLIASGTGWGKHRADTAMLLVTDNQLQFEAARERSTARASGTIPFEKAGSIAELRNLPLTFGMQVEVPSVGELVSDFTDKVPLTGAITLTMQDIQLIGGKTIQSGSLLLLSKDLAWNGVRLPEAEVAANVASDNHLRFAAEFDLDETNHLRLDGNFDVGRLAYEAGALVRIDTAGRLGTVLAGLAFDRLSGAAKLDWKGSGQLREKQHRGALDLDLASVVIATGQPLSGKIAARYDGASASLAPVTLNAGDVTVSGSGAWDGKVISLPDWKITRAGLTPLTLAARIPFEKGPEGTFFAQAEPLHLDLKMAGLALEEVTRFYTARPPLTGTMEGELTGRGAFDLIELDGRLTFRPDPRPGDRAEEQGKSPSPAALVSASMGLVGNLANPSTWDARLDAIISGLHWNGMAMENISLKAGTDTSATAKPLLAELNFDQSGTTLDATARLELGGAATFADLKTRALRVNAALAVKDCALLLHDFAPDPLKNLPLAGALIASIDGLEVNGGSLAGGSIVIGSDSFAIADQRFSPLSFTANIPERDLVTVTLAAGLDSANQITVDGKYHFGNRTYGGKLDLNADLGARDSRLRKLLDGRAIAALLPSLTVLNWEGSGDLAAGVHAGGISLTADHLTLAEGAEPVDLALSGSYTETTADFPMVKITSRPLTLAGAMRWNESRLEFLDWRGQSGGREVLTLAGGVPLDRKKMTPDQWFGQELPLDLSMRMKSLPVQHLSRLFGKESPVEGDVNLSLSATGTPAAPGLELELLFDRILVPREKTALAAGKLALAVNGVGDHLTLTGKYEHPDINPLAIDASLPFAPAAWARRERKLGDETITATAKMERSSLGFLAAQIPAIESISGEIAIDAEVGGTISKPEIRGSGLLGMDRLRLADRNAPSLHDIDLSARFEENRFVLERLHAVVAGGIVDGHGEVILKPGEEPALDLTLSGSEVLVFRNTDVNVRSDLEVRLNGPFSKALLSGEIGITNSRFFKNVDLLPLGMPTRNTSVLPTVERSPGGGAPLATDLNLGLDLAPFRDWAVDLRLYTKDPFLIRSNLVESSITADLKVEGTLGHPYPTGNIDIARGELSLPFSKIDVETGRIAFDRGTGFNGTLEFKARGKADRYQINIYLFNRLLSPQYVLTSIPPLPSEDIITLLATGTTRDELIGDDTGSMAATKAATLFIRNLRKKSDKVHGEPTLLETLEDRTELEIGRVKQETGEQTFGGKIRLWKQLFFVGDVDAESDYRALLKYVFSFR